MLQSARRELVSITTDLDSRAEEVKGLRAQLLDRDEKIAKLTQSIEKLKQRYSFLLTPESLH